MDSSVSLTSDSPQIAAEDRAMLAVALTWFANHLETPSRFNRTTSKGYYRRNTRGIAWFKDTASEHLAWMHEIRQVLERNGHVIEMLSEARVGYIVYEDNFQVVAEPFAETRTR